MAAKTFLNAEQIKKAHSELRGFDQPVQMEDLFNFPGHSREFSHWLGQSLEKRFSSSRHWKNCHPIALGSWARGELCPKSDIDLLFVGNSDSVQALVSEAQELGLKIRSRMPEDPDDWTVGVEAFDIMALLNARAFTGEGAERLSAQQALIRKRGRKWDRQLLKVMINERKQRSERYDSISNFLEPNMKFGPGGLRDLQQALFIFEIFRSKFPEECRAQRILEFYRDFFLAIRQYLHMQNLGDVVIATEQKDLAKWCSFPDSKSFMRELSIGLKRVSFFADWTIEQAKVGRAVSAKVASYKFKNKIEGLKLLEKDSGILAQERVREKVPELFKKYSKDEKLKVGKYLYKILTPELKETHLRSLFRSRMIEFCIREIDPLIGLVQHDQYHRYSADAHILQALREALRIYKKPSKVGKLKGEVKALTSNDWKILLWTCIYHDIAKGRPGDHSTLGAKIVAKDFKAFGLPLKLKEEVQWMVKNHLLLSDAAFRKNPQAASTWRQLHQAGVKGDRLKRLAVFTCIDILATNPEAWNSWKERLLFDLVAVIKSPKANKFVQLLEDAKGKQIRLAPEFVKSLDPELVAMVPRKYLLEDFKNMNKTKGDLPVLVLPKRGEETWVRFHRRKDRPGLFLDFVHLLHGAGCSINEAAIQTYKTLGAYDWFKVKTSRTVSQLKKQFELLKGTPEPVKPVEFDQILLVSHDSEEAVISFRGRDRRGALVSAAKRLFDVGFEIRWARVHTWGRQIDDIFCVKADEDLEKNFRKLCDS